jgi:hypothetical protein
MRALTGATMVARSARVEGMPPTRKPAMVPTQGGRLAFAH